uniref:Uncharacterized protein n=1 Tax=Timema cristinae TaxID=61476 RepID=A0A7R9DD60_TIMCR|nr:unnamed protein product [Timema cristinae]
MQLAMLAPYNNLAGSVAATLMTTVLTPKIRITDEDEQTFSFTSDNNLQRGSHDPRTRAANKTREEDVWSGSDEECRSPGSPRPVVRPGSPDPRRKAPVPVGVLPSILVSPCSRKSSLASRRGSDISNLNDISRRGSDCSRRGSDISKQGDNLSRRLGGDLTRRSSDASRRGSDLASRRGSECSNLADIAEDNVSVALVSPTALCLAKKKNLTWKAGEGPNSRGSSKRKPSNQGGAVELGEDDITAETTLLPQASTGCAQDKGDLTLHSILNHIAYVNKAALSGGEDPDDEQGSSRKSQVQRVLHVTYTTAILGLSLCAADLGRLYGPYGLFAATSNVTRGVNDDPDGHTGSERGPRPWPWFCFQTLCRAVEFAMGCAMANITKQPVHSRHQHYSYSLRLKHRESLYI